MSSLSASSVPSSSSSSSSRSSSSKRTPSYSRRRNVSRKLVTIVAGTRRPESMLWILDRDGVINRDVGKPGVIRVDEFVLESESAKALKMIKSHGIDDLICVCTNQSAVGKKIMTEETLKDIHYRMVEMINECDYERDDLFQFDWILYEIGEEEGWRRKPGPGMVLEALERFDTVTRAIFVGDTAKDMIAAARAEEEICKKAEKRIVKIERVLVSTGYGAKIGKCLEEFCDNTNTNNNGDGGSYRFFEKKSDIPREVLEAFAAFPENCFPLYVVKNLKAAVDLHIVHNVYFKI